MSFTIGHGPFDIQGGKGCLGRDFFFGQYWTILEQDYYFFFAVVTLSESDPGKLTPRVNFSRILNVKKKLSRN